MVQKKVDHQPCRMVNIKAMAFVQKNIKAVAFVQKDIKAMAVDGKSPSKLSQRQ
jgi:hypothetical protein